jgi:hypothetical protein
VKVEFVDALPEPAWHRNKKQGKDSQSRNIEFAAALRANPRQWAIWPNSRRANSSSIRTLASAINRKLHPAPSALRTGEFEAASRSNVLYVRYTGAVSIDPAESMDGPANANGPSDNEGRTDDASGSN